MIKSSNDIIRLNDNFSFPTYNQMLSLVEAKLASKKISPCGNYAMFKYSRKVMFEQLWFKYPSVMECRGHVYRISTGELVVAAPRKSFNYLENNWWSKVSDEEAVLVTKKYNGFLINRTIVSGDEVLLTTTGSFSSDFVDLAKQVIDNAPAYLLFDNNLTFNTGKTASYEVIHSSDPHIVDEGDDRIEALTYRYVTGENSPYDLKLMTFGEAKELAKNAKHEGFMVYHYHDDKMLSPVKLKSQLYVGRKAIMRAATNSVKNMYANPVEWAKIRNLSDKYAEIAVRIVSTFPIEMFDSMSDQARRSIIEHIEKEIQ